MCIILFGVTFMFIMCIIETSNQIQFQRNLKVLGQSAFRRDLQLGWQETLKLNEENLKAVFRKPLTNKKMF